MSEVLRDLVVSLSLDGDNFSRNLTSINKQIQEAESEFKRAASGVDNFEKSVKDTQAQLSSLQQKAVTQYQRALEAANKKLENAYTRQGKLSDALDQAKQKNAALESQVTAAAEGMAAVNAELDAQYVRTEITPGQGEAVNEVVEARQLRDQSFRIYRVVPEFDMITVYARHVFYDLMDNMIRKYEPSATTTGANVAQGIASGCLSEHDFTVYSDLDSATEQAQTRRSLSAGL